MDEHSGLLHGRDDRGAAVASFDMVMVLDRTEGVIRRMEPTGAGISLGNFGHNTFDLNAFGLFLHQPAGQVTVGSTTALYVPVMNYNTGAYVNDTFHFGGTKSGSSGNGLVISLERFFSSAAVFQGLDGRARSTYYSAASNA